MNTLRKTQPNLFCSVIIPTLNEENNISNLLRDLLSQTFVEFEIIIVDGSSDDDTVGVARSFIVKFKRRKVRLTVLSVKKRNVSFQRNFGAQKAHGVFLQFLDADVRLRSDHIYLMQKNMYKKHALFATSKLKADSNNIFDKLIVFGMNTSVRILNWSSYAFVIGLHTVIHTQTFRTLDGFDETITFGEDHDLTKRAIKKNIKPIVLPKPVVTMSLRRYRKYGRVKTVVTLVRTFIHETFIGPVSRESINYKMGGET